MEALQALTQYVKSTVPNPQAMLRLRLNERAAGITFSWQGVEFFVNTSLYVFEVRGHTLYITGASTLMQCVLARRKANDKNWAVLLEHLSEAESVLRDERFSKGSFEIVRRLRGIVEQWLGKSSVLQSDRLLNLASARPASLPFAA